MKRFAIGLLMALAARVLPAVGYLPNGDYVIYTALNKDDVSECLDVCGVSQDECAQVWLWNSEGSGAKTFALAYDTEKDAYVITAKHSGKLVSLATNGTQNVVQLSPLSKTAPTDNQRWLLEPAGNGEYYHIHILSKKGKSDGYMEVNGGIAEDGAAIVLKSGATGNKQLFRFEPVSFELPDGFSMIDSLEAMDKQYVDTGYVPKANTCIVADLQALPRTIPWGTFFGVTGNDSSKDGILLRYYETSNDLNGWFCNEKYDEAKISDLANQHLLVELKSKSLTINGTSSGLSSKGEPCQQPIYLFCVNNGGKPWRYQAMQIYSFRIFEGNVLKRNFVPCVHTDDGAPGLYETEERKFHPLITAESSGLPYLYQKKDSIDVPCGQYIDTDYRPNQKTHVSMTVGMQEKLNCNFFGCKDVKAGGAFELSRLYGGGTGNPDTYSFAINKGSGNAQVSNVWSDQHTVEIGDLKFRLDGNEKGKIADQGAFQFDLPLYLFAVNQERKAVPLNNQGTITCYGCTISEGSTVVRNCIPCVRTTDGVQGLYDLAGDKFYAVMGEMDASVADYRDKYLETHDFTSETFVEFNQMQEDELQGFLEAAKIALVHATKDYSDVSELLFTKRKGPVGVKYDDSYGYINVRLTLRNTKDSEWTLSKKIVELIRGMANWKGNNSASLVIEANPDYFPEPQTYEGRLVTNAFCSLNLDGGPIVIVTNERSPLEFEVEEYSSLRTKGYSTSVLYGLTFKGCKHPGGKGGAIVTNQTKDKRNAVRLINCTFSNCSAEQGGAVYAGRNMHTFKTESTEFYCPGGGVDPDRFRASFPGSQLTEGDFRGIRGSNLYHCTFDSCSSTKDGGAVHGTFNHPGTVITDCTFNSCRSDDCGGGISYAQSAYRCTFANCTAKSKGGGSYSAHNVVCCLFSGCRADSKGAAVDRNDSTHVHVVSCTLDDCKAQKDDWAIVTMDGQGDKVVGCLLVRSSIKKNDHVETGTYSFESVNFFISSPYDYHIKPESESIRQIQLGAMPVTTGGEWELYIIGTYDDCAQTKWTYKSLSDRDGQEFPTDVGKMIAGCYRAYTPKEWDLEQNRKKPYEWKSLNPLEVTVAEDVVNPKDGKISFREACLYLERHQTAPGRVCIDQWPKITFALPRESRAIDVTNAVALSDARRVAVYGDGLSGRQPVVIDGGSDGMTFRNVGAGAGLLALDVAGIVSNVNFRSGTVSAGENEAPVRGNVRVPVLFTNRMDEVGMKYVVKEVSNDRNVWFDNCAFESGTNGGWLASSKWGNVRFVGCSFLNAADGRASGAVDLSVESRWDSRFDCCTFAGFRATPHVIRFTDNGGDLRLANCTFADNDVTTDVRINVTDNYGAFHAFNCIFADRTAYEKTYDGTRIYCPIQDLREYKKGDLMVNVVTDDPNEVFDSQRFARVVRGVAQCAYKPKHAFTARYGRDAYTFEDGLKMNQPALDIFRQPQTGLFHSMGSYYLDDVETASIGVTTEEDVTDPYDDEISLREAINYGGVANGSFVQGMAVSPTFGDGVTSVSVTGAIRIAANTAYGDYALRIGPAKGSDLTIGSGTDSQDGVFVQDPGTKLLQFSRVRFERCGTLEGAGGVLATEGRYRFDDCTFDSCWAAGLRPPPCEILTEINGEITKLTDAGFDQGDFGLSGARAITNTAVAVAEAKVAIAKAYGDQGGGIDAVREAAVSAATKLASTVIDVRNVLTNAVNGMSGQRTNETDVAKRDVLQSAIDAAEKWNRELAAYGSSSGSGGAICASGSAEGNVCNISAHDGFALGAGGVIASGGDLVGVNLTFCGNMAVSGGAVVCTGGTNLFASVAFVDNDSAMNGAVHVRGGQCGIANSIIIANTTSEGEPNVTAEGFCETNIAFTICDATKKEDVFANGGAPVIASSSNGIDQLYYPLSVTGKASGTGAYVFFTGETKGGGDSREAGWLSNVFYSTDPNGFKPKAQPLFATKRGFNTSLLHDQLGNLIESWDGYAELPTSMGPVPKVPAVAVSNVVTTVLDDERVREGAVSFRAAAEYAISNGVPLVISDELFSGGTAVFELNRQIDVPKGKTLRIDAGSGRTIELHPAEGKETNRFFNVSGTLSAVGLTLRGGYSRSAYESMSLRPVNDDDGGAVWGVGPMAFTNCVFIDNRAKGSGGAIYSHGGLSLAGCTFTGNRAGWDGGAVYSDREKLVVTQTVVTANSAVRLAGGLFVHAEDVSTVRPEGVEVVDSRIVGNEAGGMTEVVRPVDWVKFEGSDVGSEDGAPVVVLDVTASGADSIPVANVVIGILGEDSPGSDTVPEQEEIPELEKAPEQDTAPEQDMTPEQEKVPESEKSPEPVIADAVGPTAIDLTGGETSEPSAMTVRQGLSYGWALTSAPGAKVSVRGLPKGLKLVSRAIKEGTKTVGRTYSVEGVPSKAGAYTVTFKTALNKKTTVSTMTVTVLSLADWASGTFDGGSGAGLLSLKVSSSGKLNGQYLEGGRKWKLRATAYDRYDEGAEAYVAKVVGKFGSGKKAVAFTNELTFARDSLGGFATNDLFLTRQNMWKREPWKTIGRRFPKDGEVVLRPGVVSADDTITLKFAASGKVSAKGLFGGRSVSGKTSVLCPQTEPDAATGAFDGVAFVYFPPKKGGALAYGYAVCIRIRWNGERFGLIEE